jgi:hypothetical protein
MKAEKIKAEKFQRRVNARTSPADAIDMFAPSGDGYERPTGRETGRTRVKLSVGTS